MFSKSANASPLSIRSAFVSRYDNGKNSYISHMNRNSFVSSLYKNKTKNYPNSDNESDFSKSSHHSSRSRKSVNNQSEDSGNESNSLKKRNHHKKRTNEKKRQPELVNWEQIKMESHHDVPYAARSQQLSAVVRSVSNYVSQGDPDSCRYMQVNEASAYQHRTHAPEYNRSE